MRDRLIELIAPEMAAQRGGAVPRPAYTVRVQVQRGNPDQIAQDNEFILQAVQICAQAGTPLPAEEVIRLLEGHRIKESVLQAVKRAVPAAE